MLRNSKHPFSFLCSFSGKKLAAAITDKTLRTLHTIVIAHTFCASRDTRVFISVMLTNTVVFLRGLKLSGESRS